IADILVGSPQNEVLAYHSSGERVDEFPVSVGSDVNLSCAILNLEPISGPVDSSKQIAAVSEDGFVYMWQVGGNFSDTANPWPMEGLNAQHTRMIPFTIPPTPPVALQLIPPGQFYNYPNPAENQTTIRYFLTQPAAVDLKFYDLSGNLVDRGSQAGLANTDNEFVWDCSRIVSGIYLCRLEAASSNLRQVKFTKIAIVK
ncbi:MAG: T9SS type A sorting domain-containing protein, partial [candidate division Zixibacteria bacterium]|nr:T9SS type A sorting domain-containing protein [candidate division Zixibacteria bacterium]